MSAARLWYLVGLVTVLGSAAGAAAQEPPPGRSGLQPRALYIEAGGLPAFDGGPYSVNLEQRLLPHTHLRAGAFVGPVDSEMTVMVPILLQFIAPGARHNVEFGAGVRWDVAGATSDELRLAAIAGYRYHELPGSAVLRAGLSFDMRSLDGGSDAWTLGPWPYLSIGFAF